jgi:DNA primase
MRADELQGLLQEIGLQNVRRHTGRKGTNFMVCCPFHGERKPSCGVVLEGRDVYGQCYSCKETFSLPKLVGQCLTLSIYEAIIWLQEKYNVHFREFQASEKALRKYDEAVDDEVKRFTRHELPYVKLAPYRSGKETHGYFFNRGFTNTDAKLHMIGWDRIRKRITIPVFHPDGILCGFSGRAVLEQKIELPDGRKVTNPAYTKVYGESPKYYIYDNFPISEVLYGSHNFRSVNNGTHAKPRKRAIIVEGMFDRIWMYKTGFAEALGIIVAKMSMDRKNGQSTQAQILHKLGVEDVYFMHDNDEAGEVGKEVAHEILKDDFRCFDMEYPEDFKDPVGMTRIDIELMIENSWLYGRKKGRLRRYE